MASFHFDLVSPERLLFAGEVGQVDLPGSEGDLGVLAGHAPLVTAVRSFEAATICMALVICSSSHPRRIIIPLIIGNIYEAIVKNMKLS